jgi:putative membrane protein
MGKGVDDPMMGYGNGYGMGWFGGLGMVLFWGFLVFGIVMLLRWYSNQPGRGVSPAGNNAGASNQALEIARERLAKGEIKPEEFESIKRSL